MVGAGQRVGAGRRHARPTARPQAAPAQRRRGTPARGRDGTGPPPRAAAGPRAARRPPRRRRGDPGMSASDAIVIGEAWISEHFFTTDTRSQSFLAKVLERRKAWDDADVETTRSRLLAARGELESTLAG